MCPELLLNCAIPDPGGSSPFMGLDFSRQLLLLEMFCWRVAKGFRLDDASVGFFVFCMTCRGRGDALCSVEETEVFEVPDDDECSRELIAVPCRSMAAV